ncbi:hypothetical protein GOD64_10845 [Sinorhizobium medicae]|nr:hypothetical protein [Sinorhizobium medicae]MDX1218517.1 hypothetical protein [Sinorhizobium medicae]
MTTLADRIAEETHRGGYGPDVFVLAVLPSGESFLCRPAGGESMSSARLNRQQTVEALIELYGLAAFRGQ